MREKKTTVKFMSMLCQLPSDYHWFVVITNQIIALLVLVLLVRFCYCFTFFHQVNYLFSNRIYFVQKQAQNHLFS